MLLPSNPTCVLVQMQATTLGEAPAHRHMNRHAFGSVALSHIASVPQRVEALLDEVPAHALESTQFQFVHSGSLIVEQNGEQTSYAAGEVAVYDASQPFGFVYRHDFSTTIVQVPSLLVGAPPPRSAGRLDPASTGRAVLGGLLRSSPWSARSRADPMELSSAVIGALRLAVAESTAVAGGEGVGAHPPADVLRRMVLDHVHHHRLDPTLSVGSTAAALGVSLRSVHGAFDGRPETPGALIRRLRLATAGELLLDGHAVADVARRVGYRDTTAFIRSWAAFTGSTPARWRREQLGG
ncbi:helix-turn-helix transcriptional regulator [Herbiconiux sp. A18JL235]|uniref:Helix-turn-helix transcriptional regulator n=1 Tax=Herbiconiux sp. A18JL235 TaxID=3152363 RepID=A0AB39BFN0_9MICO